MKWRHYRLRWDSINTTHSSPCTKDGKEDMCSNPGSYFTAAQREGSTAAWNTPVFPTTTLPNIFTIATGTGHPTLQRSVKLSAQILSTFKTTKK